MSVLVQSPRHVRSFCASRFRASFARYPVPRTGDAIFETCRALSLVSRDQAAPAAAAMTKIACFDCAPSLGWKLHDAAHHNFSFVCHDEIATKVNCGHAVSP